MYSKPDKCTNPVKYSCSTLTHERFSCASSDDSISLINQLDGNASLSSTYFLDSSSYLNHLADADSLSSAPDNKIPVITGFRPTKQRNHEGRLFPRNLKTIRRDNKTIQGLSLPVVSNYNMRSIFPKLDSYAEDFHEREIGLSFLSEIWEKSLNKKHQYKLEEMFETKGIIYISTPRPGLKRGGGVAIAANPSKFSLAKLNVQIPHQLEVSWGLLKPRHITGSITKIICCAFYSPPRSKKKTKLIEHLSTALQDLLLDHPGAGIIMAGDRNDLTVERLLTVDSSLRQIVNVPTHGKKILDVIITNIWRFFNDPVTVMPVPVDDVTKGVPSDHLGVVVTPILNAFPPSRLKRAIVFRPMPDSLLNSFGKDICNESWDFLAPDLSSTELTEAFQLKITTMIDHHLPTQAFTITELDQP